MAVRAVRSIGMLAGVAALVAMSLAAGQAQAQDNVENLPPAIKKVAVPKNDSSAAAAETLVIDKAQTSLIKNAFIAAPMSGVISDVEVVEGDLARRHDHGLRPAPAVP